MNFLSSLLNPIARCDWWLGFFCGFPHNKSSMQLHAGVNTLQQHLLVDWSTNAVYPWTNSDTSSLCGTLSFLSISIWRQIQIMWRAFWWCNISVAGDTVFTVHLSAFLTMGRESQVIVMQIYKSYHIYVKRSIFVKRYIMSSRITYCKVTYVFVVLSFTSSLIMFIHIFWRMFAHIIYAHCWWTYKVINHKESLRITIIND